MATYPQQLSWLPDWRNASQYPTVEGTSGTQWAWEFLRRNPEYLDWHRKARTLPWGSRKRSEMEPVLTKKFRIVAGCHEKGFPPDPSENDPGEIFFSGQPTNPFQHILDGPPDPRKIYLEFDLNLPLNSQIKNVRKIFQSRNHIHKFHLNQFQIYLRILDAKQDQSSPSLRDIAQVIYHKETSDHESMRDHPAKQKVEGNLKAAYGFRDEKFWIIPHFFI